VREARVKFRERVEKMSQGPSVIFFGKFFLWNGNWEEKKEKASNFFLYSVWNGPHIGNKFREISKNGWFWTCFSPRMDTPGGTRDAAVSPRCDIRRKRGDGLSM
jgi:hypothetical protein